MGDQITVTSTTGSQADAEAAAQYDVDVKHGESPQSPGRIYLTSTTASQEEVDEAATAFGDTLISSDGDGEGYVTPLVHTENVYTTTGTLEETQEVQRDIDEQREEIAARYLGKPLSVRQRMNRLLDDRVEAVKIAEQYQQENKQLRQQLAQTPQPAQQPEGDQQQQASAADQEFRRHYQQAQAALPQREQEARQRIPDLPAILEKCDQETPVSSSCAFHIVQLENPFDVAVHLARNPGIIARLWALEAAGRGSDALGELNGLSYALKHNHLSQQPQPRQSQPARRAERQGTPTPAPIRPLGGTSAATSSSADPGQMDYQQYRRWYAKNYGDR